MKKLMFPLYITLSIFACSCKPDEMPVDVNELLTSATWTQIIDYDDSDKDGVFEEFGDACDKDNTMLFKADGKAEYGQGTQLCDPDDPTEVITADWALENGNTELILQFPLDTQRFKIVSISSTELVLDELESGASAITHRVIFKR